ncbi:hypothetical protein HZH68_001384 [Vespula germanica]|uniref:Uncharacterized protein n=1 Tax=Vespula germanica TaxID=30212 RepID=A0A834NVM1_VESGE|nr:hypothetical protein HZH68_001384 [Vespula germanica]
MENHCLENRPASTSFSCLVNVSLGSARGGGGGGGGSSTSDGGASSGDGGGCGGGSSSLACSCGTMQRAGMRPNEIRGGVGQATSAQSVSRLGVRGGIGVSGL